MFNYVICNIEDDDVFYSQCKSLENNIPNIIKGNFIEADILQQEYFLNNKKIIVLNDWVTGVTINSEIDLKPFFKK